VQHDTINLVITTVQINKKNVDKGK
jgi:hypothetical protein